MSEKKSGAEKGAETGQRKKKKAKGQQKYHNLCKIRFWCQDVSYLDTVIKYRVKKGA